MITVGDRVTETMHELGRTPDLQIVDQVERRVRRAAPEMGYVTLIRASNPAGKITREAILAIESAMKSAMPARVLIEGEEDLLAIPAIEAAPTGATLYYGQPGEGVVMVRVDARSKSSAASLHAHMKPEVTPP